jgi:hypothetical protein
MRDMTHSMRIIATLAILVPLSANARIVVVEADNGSVYNVDTDTIERGNTGRAMVVVYGPGNPGDSVPDGTRYMFDCKGHAMLVGGIGGYSDSFSVPPRSVGGRIERIACGKR